MAAKAHSAQTRTWIYEANVDSQWSSRAKSSPRQRALETYSLIVALNRAVRLRKNSDFQRVKQQGHSIVSPLLVLVWMPNDVTSTRVGFVVSKRIAKHAVDRNHMKRLLSEAMRGLLPRLPGGLDIVVSARQKANTANLGILEQDMVTLLRRAKLLEAPSIPDE
jgi:ribonuclease P protein component